ncbi:hypothetical protein [Almyronema epifaneia]|uniref:Uncharacterized protein n=1 Tax=Almyronema epifaneia S1 TaxID=2991925 RepID=A0ABW6IDD4_9CYAN
MEQAWIFVIATLVFAIALGLRLYFAHRRTQAIAALASQLGLTFLDKGNHLIPALIWNFDLFSKGRSRRVHNVLKGRANGADVCLFDYSYRTGSGKNSSTHYHTVALLWTEKLDLPTFLLIPENLFHKIGRVFGYRDIDFGDYPQFSQRYLLRGTDEARIRQVFDYRVIPFYEQRQRTCTEGAGHAFIYYRTDGRLSPDRWSSLLNEAQTVVGLLSR